MIIFTWIGILAVTVTVIAAAACGTWIAIETRRMRRQPAPPPGRVVPQPGEVTGPLRPALLALACGPCTGVSGTVTCICAGNCGHKRCRGIAVTCDLAGALEQITRDGSSG